MTEVVEIYTNGCINCDYFHRLQKKIGIYDKITHIEFASKEASAYENVHSVPTIIIKWNGDEVKRYTNMERRDIEEIKKLYICD